MFQGKLELWIDMFQSGELPPRPASDISPPVPREYEVRVVVWNTEDVPLVDSQFLTGEKCSDIYVKGYAGERRFWAKRHFRNLRERRERGIRFAIRRGNRRQWKSLCARHWPIRFQQRRESIGLNLFN